MKPLSKSRLMAWRQCPKRLWLEVNHPELRQDSPEAQSRFDHGNEVGELARLLYDPVATGTLVETNRSDWRTSHVQTQDLLAKRQPIFEACFLTPRALCLADVLLPAKPARRKAWRMVEVKSSTRVKDYHRDDIAIQSHIAREAGLALDSVALAHVDSSWVFDGENYQGLLVEVDLTEEAFARDAEVREWVCEAHQVARKRTEPDVVTGPHCTDPFECGFIAHCRSQELEAEYPVQWLPNIRTKALKAHLEFLLAPDMREVPDSLLDPLQQRVKHCTLMGETFFDEPGALRQLKAHKTHKPPLYFLDFETVQFAVPRWEGTRPYQQIPFQFSCHHLARSGALEHREFLSLACGDPSWDLAHALIETCGDTGAILAYSASFERSRIRELAVRFPRLMPPLLAIADRIVDLLPIARANYCHPDMKGSWSIKDVLPTVAPALSYGDLDGVQHGGQAVQAYVKASDPLATPQEQDVADRQLRAYCQLDTYAMVKLWQFFAGQTHLEL